jgi:nickel/cobalt transporter (NicO) family protein
MKRLALALSLLALLVPGGALAHPLGNFTVNRYSGIELSGSRVYLHYAVDLAEIPAFQRGAEFRRPGIARRLASGLRLTVDGRRAPLRLVASRLEPRPGAAGLETLRYDAVYDAGPGGRALRFHDLNFQGRIGWKEVVVTARRGATILSSTVPQRSVSRELRAYPANLLRAPVDTTTAAATATPGTTPGVPPTLGEAVTDGHRSGGFEALVGRQELGPGLILLSLALALFWGAAHALTPGHGKAIVAAYLVGSRGRARHAFALGGIVTLTHTIGVFGLGLVTLALSEFVVPESLYPWLNLVSALLVVGVGLAVLRRRLVRRRHDHGHEHTHDHPSARGLIAMGVSGGILPCPTALVVLLAAISLHRVGFGLLLIVAFSFGLASVITGIGLLAISARSVFSRVSFEGRLVRALPALSAAAIVCLGVVMTLRSLPPLT